MIICAAAAAQTKRQVAVLPTVADVNALDPEGQIILTDKVREIASKNLPQDRFILLKQDVITNRLGGDEELYNACKDGVCIAELTKKISADYGARCDIMKRGDDLAMKFELYSVRDEAILETFTKYPAKDLFEMLAELEARLPDAFKKMIPSQPLLPPTSAPLPAVKNIYTVTFDANGGSGAPPAPQSVNAGIAITLPNQGGLTKSGYNFDGWNTNSSGTGANYSIGSSYTPADNATLYAKWNAVPAPAADRQAAEGTNGVKSEYKTKYVWVEENIDI